MRPDVRRVTISLQDASADYRSLLRMACGPEVGRRWAGGGLVEGWKWAGGGLEVGWRWASKTQGACLAARPVAA